MGVVWISTCIAPKIENTEKALHLFIDNISNIGESPDIEIVSMTSTTGSAST